MTEVGLREKKPSARTGTAEQTTNRIPIDGFCRAIEPIERRGRVVVPGARIGAIFEEDRDRLHKTCFGSVVESCRMPAVGPLSCKALVICTCTVAKERDDIFGIVFSALIPRA